jgi:AraC-like DNA-binding protein
MAASQGQGTPVQRSAFASNDEAEITEFIKAMYADNSSRFAPIRDGARFAAATHDSVAVGADRVGTSIDYSGTSEEGFHDFVFFTVHDGSVQVRSREGSTVATRGDVSFYPLGIPIEFAMHRFDVTTLRLPAGRVRQVAEDTTGLPAARLHFDDITPVSASMHRYWRSLVSLASAALMDPESPLSSHILADDLARTMATAALHTFPNSTMTRQHEPGPGNVTPATIRRAVAHIDANAHRPLQLNEIAQAAGTSVRALQYGFRQHLDTTPLGYLRRVRLELARQDLEAADPTQGATVAEVATRWGFPNAGRFAAAYRSAFGVTPRQSLRS